MTGAAPVAAVGVLVAGGLVPTDPGIPRPLRTGPQGLDTPDILAFAEIGLDRQEAAAVLSDRHHRSQVENDQREAHQIGAHGTPFLVTDGHYTVPGAICTDDLSRLARADQISPFYAAHENVGPAWDVDHIGGYARRARADSGCST